MSGKFVRNRSFIGDMRRQPEYRKALEESADVVRDRAAQFAERAHAPWMKRQSETIVVDAGGDSVSVVNTDYGGHLMEWGSKNNPAHAPLRRGVRAAGLKLTEV